MSDSQKIWCIECRVPMRGGEGGDWQPQLADIEWIESDAVAEAEERRLSQGYEWRAVLYSPAPASPLTDEEIAERAMGVLCDFIPYPEAVLPEGVDDAVKRAIRHALRLARGGE